MPVRVNEDVTLYRSFDFGQQMKLIMLDERLDGRTAPPADVKDPDRNNPARKMLGDVQYDWLINEINSAEQDWIVIGNQVMFSDMILDSLGGQNMDAWDGYPVEKKKLIDFLKTKTDKNIIFVTGDTHTSWATEIPTSHAAYANDQNEKVGVEFGIQSVTSANYDEGGGGTARAKKIEASRRALNKHVKFNNFRDHGYMILTLNSEEAKAEYYYFDTISEPFPSENLGKTLRVKKGTNTIK